jgi:hypothetical protein
MKTTNQIVTFFHCAKCMDEKPDNISPQEYGSIEAGWTSIGFQLWCKRHDMNIVHFDLMGQKLKVAEKK